MDENGLERTLMVVSYTELYMDRVLRRYQEEGADHNNNAIYELEMQLHDTLGDLRHRLWHEVNGDKEKPLYSEVFLQRYKKKKRR